MKTKKINIELILLFLSIFFVYNFNYNTTNSLFIVTNTFIILFTIVEYISILRKPKISFNKFLISLILFFIISLVSVLYSYSADASISKVKTLLILILYFGAILNYINKDVNNLNVVIKILVFSGLVGALYTIGSSNWLLGDRANKIIGDANQAGAYFAYTCILALYLFKKGVITNKLVISLLVIMFCFVNIISGSRSMLISTIIGILLYFIFNSKKEFFLKRWKTYLKMIIFIGVLVAAIIYIPALNKIVGERFLSFFEIMQGKQSSINESSTETRLFLIREAYSLFSHNVFTILFGNGIGSFQPYAATHFNFDAFCHNNYLELLSGVGILGTICYYYSYLKLLLLSILRRKKSRESIFIFIILIQILIAHFFVVFYYQKMEFVILSILVGMIHYDLKGSDLSIQGE